MIHHNLGIGQESATHLALCGATVILACRDIQKGMEASQKINEKLKTFSALLPFANVGKTLFMRLDLADVHSVLDFSDRVRQQFSRIDIVVNNAGLNTAHKMEAIGVEQLFHINYLGHYLLFRSLESLLSSRDGGEGSEDSSTGEQSPSKTPSSVPSYARVINLSSVMHHVGQSDFEASAFHNYTPAMKAKYSYYSDSKLYMNFLTMEINRRYGNNILSEANVDVNNDSISEYLSLLGNNEGGDCAANTANMPASTHADKSGSHSVRPIVAISVNPGAVRSDIWRNYPFKFLFNLVMHAFFLDVVDGAATSIYAATVSLPTIRSFFSERSRQPFIVSRSTAVAAADGIRCPAAAVENCECSTSYGGGTMVLHHNLPYCIPYAMPARFLAFEMIGIYAGPRLSWTTLPENSTEIARGLWDFSAQLCMKLLTVAADSNHGNTSDVNALHGRNLEFLR